MRKYIITIFVLLVVAFGLILLSLGYKTSSLNNEEISGTTPAKIGNADVTIEYALTPLERSRGLSGRKNLPDQAGLLFVFPDIGIYNFWMRDMNFPIDIIWINRDMRVVSIDKNVSPDSYPVTFSPPSPIMYVLEVNAGFSERYGIHEGDELILTGGWPQ